MFNPQARKWLVLWSIWAAGIIRQPTPTVKVSGGELRGVIAKDSSHYRYLAIPYATVKERFQEAGPEPSWEGVYDAFDENVRCTQRLTNTQAFGQENCLKLNVFTPIEKSKTLRPVMLFIHGGGFRDGSGSPLLYGPEYFIAHDIILVSINYRLEVLGFLCLGIKEAPGNMGLKDQVLALKWVKRNINNFGGDPDNVTIFGESAGSASVMYHIVSPMSSGLFHRAIMQSGSAIAPWTLQYEPLKIASQLAYQFGYETKDPHNILELFTNKSADTLLLTRVPRRMGDIVLSENIFVPCVEETIPGVLTFLSDTPYNLISKGQYNKVPIIIGYNNNEGIMFTAKENATTISNMNFYSALPRDLDFPNEAEKLEIANRLQNIYVGDDLAKKSLVNISRYQGDSSIVYPVVFTTELMLRTMDMPIYGYKFCYDGLLNIIKFLSGLRSEPGATHADELFYLFKPNIILLSRYFEMKTIKRMTTMWTNFAKFGDPTPSETPLLKTKWRQIDKKDPHLLVIDNEFSYSPLWDNQAIRFWNETYTKYRRKLN